MAITPIIHTDPSSSGQAAAAAGAAQIRRTLAAKGRAVIIVATGASQFHMLEQLVREPEIDWSKVTAFHLDEYVGLPLSHGASFRKYLWERFVSRLPLPLAAFHYIDGEAPNPAAECQRLAALLDAEAVDVAFIGIGENAHIAFNDPPADFSTEEAYLVVKLDEACRRQQLGEGWFPTLEAVPQEAISMAPKRILRSKHIVCTVPDARKAQAVARTLQGPVTPDVPASLLQTHADVGLYLDTASAEMLVG